MKGETKALIETLRARDDKTCSDAARLIEWLAGELVQAIDRAESYRANADDAAAVLCRIGDHLGRLTQFTEGRIADDPFPEARQ